MKKKGKYEGANNQSLPSHSESQLLKYIAEYNPRVLSFGQYAKTKVEFFGSQSIHATPEDQRLRKRVKNRYDYYRNHPDYLRKELIERNFTTNGGIEFDTTNRGIEFELPKPTVQKQETKKKAPKMQSPSPGSGEYFGSSPFPPGSPPPMFGSPGPYSDQPRSIDLEMNAQNNEFIVVLSPKVPVATKDDTEATVSNIRIYFAISDLEEFILKKYAAYILPDGNTICFQGPMEVGQFWKNSSSFVDKISSVVKGLSSAELISHGEVGKALRAKPITTTYLRLPEDWTVSPTYFNKASDNNTLKINVFDHDVDVMHPYTKKKLFTQKHIYGSICVSVDGSYSVYEEVTEEHDATKELNEVLDMFSIACSTTDPSTSASKEYYNSSSHSTQQEQYKHQKSEGEYYCVDIPTNVAPGESFTTSLGGRLHTVVCPVDMRTDCMDREVRIRKL